MRLKSIAVAAVALAVLFATPATASAQNAAGCSWQEIQALGDDAFGAWMQENLEHWGWSQSLEDAAYDMGAQAMLTHAAECSSVFAFNINVGVMVWSLFNVPHGQAFFNEVKWEVWSWQNIQN